MWKANTKNEHNVQMSWDYNLAVQNSSNYILKRNFTQRFVVKEKWTHGMNKLLKKNMEKNISR